MTRVALVGHSQVGRLPMARRSTHFTPQPHSQPYQIRKFARGGAKVSNFKDSDILKQLIEWKPHMLFLWIGSNDIADYCHGQSRKLVSDIMGLRKYIWKAIARAGNHCRIIILGLEKRYKGKCRNNHWRCGHPHNNPQCNETTRRLPNGQDYNAMRGDVNHKLRRLLNTNRRRENDSTDFLPIGNDIRSTEADGVHLKKRGFGLRKRGNNENN